MHYKYLISDEDTYRLKSSFSLFHAILSAWLFIGIALVYYNSYYKSGLFLIVFNSLILIRMLLRPPKTGIAPHEKIIRINTQVRGRKPLQYHFSDFQGFELQTVYCMRIPVNTELFGCFASNGKNCRHILGQSFSRKRMQHLSNELDEIIKN